MSAVKPNPGSDTLTLRTLLNVLTPVKHKWRKICIQLGIPNYKLRQFEKDDDPIINSLDYWLNGNTDVPITWESVVAALDTPDVDEPGLAKKLREKWTETTNKATKETIEKDDDGQEAVKDFNSVKMSRWLHAKGLSEEDYEKIKKGNISGRAFLLCSKKDWIKLNISVGGIYTLMDLQEEIKDGRPFPDSVGYSTLTQGPQGPQQTQPSFVAPLQLSESESIKYGINTQATRDGSDLTLQNIKIFLNKEDFPADRGEDLGEYLGIKPGIISALKKKSGGDPDRLLSIIITEWLNNDKEKSWQKLSTALRYCGHSLMAEKIGPQEETVSQHQEGLTKRPKRSWQNRIPDSHLMPLLDSNKGRETIRDDEGHALSQDESPEEIDKFIGQEAVKDFNSVKMSRWLHAKGLSEEDYEKIKERNISGRAFLLCSKEDWTKLNISFGGIYTLMDLQEELLYSLLLRPLSDSISHRSTLTQGPQQTQPSSVASPQLTGQNTTRPDHSYIYKKLQPYAYKWRDIAIGLRFTPTELNIIEANPSRFNTAPGSYLSAMLSDWLEWAPGDARGSTKYATMEDLRSAVDRAGLGLTAREL